MGVIELVGVEFLDINVRCLTLFLNRLVEDNMAEVGVVEMVGVELLDVNVKCLTLLLSRLVENET